MRDQYEAVLDHHGALLALMEKYKVTEFVIPAVAPRIKRLSFVIPSPTSVLEFPEWFDLHEEISELMQGRDFDVFVDFEVSRCDVSPWISIKPTLDEDGTLPVAKLTLKASEAELREALIPVSNYDPDNEATYACNLRKPVLSSPVTQFSPERPGTPLSPSGESFSIPNPVSA